MVLLHGSNEHRTNCQEISIKRLSTQLANPRWPCGLRRRSGAARLPESRVRFPLRAWILSLIPATSWPLIHRSPTGCLWMISKPRKSGSLGPSWAVAPQKKKNQQTFTNESDIQKYNIVTARTVSGVSPPHRTVQLSAFHFVCHASTSFDCALWITRLKHTLLLFNECSYMTPCNPRRFSIRVTEFVMQPLQRFLPVFLGSWFSFKYPVTCLPEVLHHVFTFAPLVQRATVHSTKNTRTRLSTERVPSR